MHTYVITYNFISSVADLDTVGSEPFSRIRIRQMFYFCYKDTAGEASEVELAYCVAGSAGCTEAGEVVLAYCVARSSGCTDAGEVAWAENFRPCSC